VPATPKAEEKKNFEELADMSGLIHS
jgi:hypothetical protein